MKYISAFLMSLLLPVGLFGQQMEQPRWEISAHACLGVGRQFYQLNGDIPSGRYPELLCSYGGSVSFYPFSTGAFQWGISIGANQLYALQYIHEDSSVHSYGSAWGFPVALKGKWNIDSISMLGIMPFVSLSAGYMLSAGKKYPLYDEQNVKHAMYGFYFAPEVGVRSGALFIATGVWLQEIRQGVAESYESGYSGGHRVKRLNPFHLTPAISIRLGIRF